MKKFMIFVAALFIVGCASSSPKAEATNSGCNAGCGGMHHHHHGEMNSTKRHHHHGMMHRHGDFNGTRAANCPCSGK